MVRIVGYIRGMGKNTGILERRFIPKDSVIMRQGEEGYSAYLIQSGSVSVFSESGEQEVELAKLESGQIFGEMALIFDEPRTASVRAAEDCNLIVISREAFKEKLDRSDPTIRAIVLMLTQRIVSGNNVMINKKETLEDLEQTARIVYDNAAALLPQNQQSTLEQSVLPKLTDFIDALKDFEEKFSDEA